MQQTIVSPMVISDFFFNIYIIFLKKNILRPAENAEWQISETAQGQ